MLFQHSVKLLEKKKLGFALTDFDHSVDSVESTADCSVWFSLTASISKV